MYPDRNTIEQWKEDEARARFTARMLGVLLVVLVALIALCARSAWAQTAPVAPGVDPATTEAVKAVLAAAGSGKWLLAVMVLLQLAVKFCRGPVAAMLPMGKLKTALTSTAGGWGLSIVGSITGALVAALVAGTHLDVPSVISLLIGAFVTTLAAAGSHELVGDVKAAGAAAALTPGPTINAP